MRLEKTVRKKQVFLFYKYLRHYMGQFLQFHDFFIKNERLQELVHFLLALCKKKKEVQHLKERKQAAHTGKNF